MKIKLMVMMLCFVAVNSYAGFYVKHAAKKPAATEMYSAVRERSTHTLLKARMRLARLAAFLPHDHYSQGGHSGARPGWPGIASAVCSGVALAMIVLGITGVVTSLTLSFFPLSIIGLIFGIIGMKRHRKFRGLALAGLIVSSLEILFSALLIALIVALSSGGGI